jgi:hypothetical protein
MALPTWFDRGGGNDRGIWGGDRRDIGGPHALRHVWRRAWQFFAGTGVSRWRQHGFIRHWRSERNGKPDILGVAQDENGVYEFLNDGTGNFGFPQGRAVFQKHSSNNQQSFPVNYGGDSNLFFQDVNGDGKPGAVYVDYDQLGKTYSLGVSLNQGLQGFAAPVFSTIDTNNNDVIANALGDFHGTGQPDSVVATDPAQPGGPIGVSGGIMIMQSQGQGKFSAPVTIYPQSNYATNMAATDLNHDGKQDLLICETPNSGGGSQLTVLMGNGNGTFKSPAHYAYPGGMIGNGCLFFSAISTVTAKWTPFSTWKTMSSRGFRTLSSIWVMATAHSRRPDLFSARPVFHQWHWWI